MNAIEMIPSWVALYGCAFLTCFVVRHNDITVLAKPDFQRTPKERTCVARGLRRSVGIELVLFIPAIATILFLVAPLLLERLPQTLKTPIQSSPRACVYAVLGVLGYAFADGVTIGFETNGSHIRDVLVRNCDILIARGGSRVDGHSAFSIICDGPAWITDIRYEDIRVEQEVLNSFELHVTDGTKYQDDPPGHIKGVYLKDIRWAADCPIVLKGFDAQHRVEDV